MSNWTTVKNPKIVKIEKHITRFWGEDEYLEPHTKSTWTTNQPQAPVINPVPVEPGVKYYPRLNQLKRKLMETKSQLDAYNIISWSKHTNFTYLFSELTRRLRTDYDVELCTTAWTKMWEILHWYEPPQSQKNVLRSLHLCEGPGSFITCVNQFVKTNLGKNIVLDWSAITLSDQENSLFDRYFPHWAPNNWFFGPDGTGDILNPENIINGVWAKYPESEFKPDLVTADGSVSCQHDPNNQELIVTPLKHAEIVSALGSLRQGGTFIIKFFTVFEPHTICYLWLLATLFQKISIFKPVTSKPGNSEIYIICQNLLQEPDKEYLYQLLDCHPMELIFDPRTVVPKKFIGWITRAMTNIVNRQTKVIDQNIDWYQSRRRLNGNQIGTSKDYAFHEYIKKYGIKKMNNPDLTSLFV